MLKSDLIKNLKWLFWLASIYFSTVAIAIPLVSTEHCDRCYELDKGEFRYIIYDGLPESIIGGTHRKLVESKPKMLKTFNLKTVPIITVKVWGNEESY
uniref:hypothetical protein n=1 Tax=Amphritea sp. TaxID=1872502 RepID=UPI003D0B11FD